MDFETVVDNLIVPLVFFITILAIVVVSLYFSHKNRAEKYRLIEKLLDRGETLTPELLTSINQTLATEDRNRSSGFGNAIHQIFIGIGLAVFFWALTRYTGAPYFLIAIGIFPFVSGLARLITILYEKRN